MFTISQGIERYKVPVVEKSGKLNETIEVSVLWSIGRPPAQKMHSSPAGSEWNTSNVKAELDL